MAKTTVGALNVKLTATTSAFSKGIRRASMRIGSFAKRIGRATLRIAKIGATMTAVALGAVALFVRQSFKLIDSLAKAASKMGITTEALASMRHGATLAGMETEKFDKSLQKMLQSIGEVQMGVGEAKEAFKRMGLPIEKLAGMRPEEQFLKIRTALDGVRDNTLKVAYAADIFGARMGVAILNMDPAKFAQATAEAHRFGAALSQVDARLVEQANDAIARMQLSLRGVANVIAVRVAPYVADVAERIANLGVTAQAAARTGTNAFGQVVNTVGRLGDELSGVSRKVIAFRMSALQLWRDMTKWESHIERITGGWVAGQKEKYFKGGLPGMYGRGKGGMTATQRIAGIDAALVELERHLHGLEKAPTFSDVITRWWREIPRLAREAARGIPEMLRRLPEYYKYVEKVRAKVTRSQIGFRTARELGAGYGAPVTATAFGGSVEIREARKTNELLTNIDREIRMLREEGGLA